jgi:hypothetical protein
MDFSFRLLSNGYALSWLSEVLTETQRELGSGYAFRRGFDSGRSTYHLNRKWQHIIARSPLGMDLDRAKAWLRPIRDAVASLTPPSAQLLSHIAGNLCGYAYNRIRRTPVCATHLPVQTSLPQVLGPNRFLVLTGHCSLLFDAHRQSVENLDAIETTIVCAWIDGESDESLIARLVTSAPSPTTTEVLKRQTILRSRLDARPPVQNRRA